MKWFYWASWRVRCEMGLPFWSCSRPFLDTLVRDMFVHFYGDKVTFLTKRQIVSPVLSTDLSTLGITQNNMKTTTTDNLPITGDYSKIIDPERKADEFRVVGVRVKKRANKNKNNNKNIDGDDNNTLILRQTENNNKDDEQMDAEKAQDSALLTTTHVVKTDDLLKSDIHKPIKQIDANPELNTAIPQRAVDHDDEYILGDLLVDCTGGTSVLHKWCERLWNINVPTSQLKASSMYVSLFIP
eukprot:UN03734